MWNIKNSQAPFKLRKLMENSLSPKILELSKQLKYHTVAGWDSQNCLEIDKNRQLGQFGHKRVRKMEGKSCLGRREVRQGHHSNIKIETAQFNSLENISKAFSSRPYFVSNHKSVSIDVQFCKTKS